MSEPLKVSDKSQPYKFVVAAVFAVLLVLILGAINDLKSPSRTLGSSLEPITGNSTLGSNSNLFASSAAALVLDGRAQSQLRFCMNAGSVDMTLSATTTNLTPYRGLVLKGSSTLPAGFNYMGALYGITAAGTSTLSCLDI